MSLWTEIEKMGVKIGDFFTGVVKFGAAIQTVYSTLGPQTLAAMSQVFYDTIKTAGLAAVAAGDATAGNWTGTVVVSEQTAASVTALITAAKNGEKQVVADFEALKLQLK